MSASLHNNRWYRVLSKTALTEHPSITQVPPNVAGMPHPLASRTRGQTPHIPFKAAAPTCEHHLAGHEDEQHNLGVLHAVDQAGKQLRLVLQTADKHTGGRRGRQRGGHWGRPLLQVRRASASQPASQMGQGGQGSCQWEGSAVPAASTHSLLRSSRVPCTVPPGGWGT